MIGQAEIGGGRRGGRWRIALWGVPVLLLILPAIAMRFTDEVKWGPADFIVMAILFHRRRRVDGDAGDRLPGLSRRAVAVAASFLIVWVNLAVGMIGSEGNPYNLLFGGVIGVALLGSALARFRPAGMVHAMMAAALAQGLIAAGGLPADPRGALLGGMMAGLWLLAAWLFWIGARLE